MAHYDLYKSLNLSSADSSPDLARQIDRVLASGQFTNLGGRQELEIAREVLGNSDKRALYDARLADPQASSITVADLQQLSSMSMGQQSSSRGTASHQAEGDTGEIAVVNPGVARPASAASAQPQQPEPPQYRQAPPEQPAQSDYQYFVPQNFQQAPPPKKNKGAKIIAGALSALVLVAVVAAGVWFFWLHPSWKSTQAEIQEAYPNIVSSRANGSGWNDLKCEGADPDEAQEGKILCGDDELVISLVKFSSAKDRDYYMPGNLIQVLDNGQCEVESAEVEGNERPTYAVWSEDEEDMALLVSGEDAEQQRLVLPLCK